MLYPDLCRLSLRSPATGAGAGEVLVPDTPPPPKRQRQRQQVESQEEEEEESETPQQEVLRQEGLLQLILLGLVDSDDVESTCANAVKWCNLTQGHKGACDADAWKELTRRVFPDLHIPGHVETQLAGQLPEVVTAMHKAWFVYFCKSRKELRDLKNALALQTRTVADQHTGANREWLMLHAEQMELEVQLTALRKVQLELQKSPQVLPERIRSALSERINRVASEKFGIGRRMLSAWSRGAKPDILLAQTMHKREWTQLLRKIDAQEAKLRRYAQSPGMHGPETAEEQLEPLRIDQLDRLTSFEENRQQNDALWLRDREKRDYRERNLSRMMREARALIDESPPVPVEYISRIASSFNRLKEARHEHNSFEKNAVYMTDLSATLQQRIARLRKWQQENPPVVPRH